MQHRIDKLEAENAQLRADLAATREQLRQQSEANSNLIRSLNAHRLQRRAQLTQFMQCLEQLHEVHDASLETHVGLENLSRSSTDVDDNSWSALIEQFPSIKATKDSLEPALPLKKPETPSKPAPSEVAAPTAATTVVASPNLQPAVAPLSAPGPFSEPAFEHSYGYPPYAHTSKTSGYTAAYAPPYDVETNYQYSSTYAIKDCRQAVISFEDGECCAVLAPAGQSDDSELFWVFQIIGAQSVPSDHAHAPLRGVFFELYSAQHLEYVRTEEMQEIALQNLLRHDAWHILQPVLDLLPTHVYRMPVEQHVAISRIAGGVHSMMHDLGGTSVEETFDDGYSAHSTSHTEGRRDHRDDRSYSSYGRSDNRSETRSDIRSDSRGDGRSDSRNDRNDRSDRNGRSYNRV
jgi:hypothetical protein